ncbi:uncharacterized protein HKW66_Vig0125370 [Vigna angularis]|uniref:Uncharacterized protein n=1 Tax=Phaseolus angularis TaxID=3914 RepID=A0A8T0K633_PHAAN|nr:uncharacterized protein HKW66_Vig0125370 [Vigna angularis]
MLRFLVSFYQSMDSNSLIKIRFPNRIQALTVLASLSWNEFLVFLFRLTSVKSFFFLLNPFDFLKTAREVQSIEEAYKELAMDGRDFVVLKELAIELKIDDVVLAKLGVMASLQVHHHFVG